MLRLSSRRQHWKPLHMPTYNRKLESRESRESGVAEICCRYSRVVVVETFKRSRRQSESGGLANKTTTPEIYADGDNKF